MINQFLMYITLSLNNTLDDSTHIMRCTVLIHDVHDQFSISGIDTDGGEYKGTFDALIFTVENETNQPDPVVDISSLTLRDNSERTEPISDYCVSDSSDDVNTYSTGSENE